jgi:RNA polymerase sigma factor (sigma-70 family)
MPEHEDLAAAFEASRGRLRAIAYRMLGSLSDADDAVQEAWLRLSRSDADVANLGGWLTTVVSRICLDILRSRSARHEEPLGEHLPDPVVSSLDRADPEQEAELADAVGMALLVVLDKLSPTERLAFVLHDMFAVPFDDIAPIVGRSPNAAAQLASRARRRVRGSANATDTSLARQREVVGAWIAAARGGDFDALLTLLDPDVVVRIDLGALPAALPRRSRWRPATGATPRSRTPHWSAGPRGSSSRQTAGSPPRSWHSRSPQARSPRSTSWPTAPG